MKYENIEGYSEEKFRRITGVKRSTFKRMLEILSPKLTEKLLKGGRKPKLTLEDMLLAALEYLREYRTYAHVGASFGMSESQIYKIIRWIEDTLIKDGTFSLPGRKELLRSDVEYEVIIIDDTETPIERPKRGKNSTTRARKSDIQ